METKCLPADEVNIKFAASLLLGGECVALPTETVYGLAADATNESAVMRIFEAKSRPADNPLIVHVCDITEVERLVSSIPKSAMKAAEAFWPGPLTLVMERSPLIPDIITAGRSTVAVRVPSHTVMRGVIEASGLPLAAPSANRSGGPSPTRAAHVMEDMAGRIPLILDGGPCEVGLESTVLDVSDGLPVLLRPGVITLERLREVLGAVEESSYSEDEPVRSPGMKYRHYAPKAELTLVHGASPGDTAAKIERMCEIAEHDGKRAAIICFEGSKRLYSHKVYSLGALGDTQNIFHILRQVDADGIDTVFCEGMENAGIGRAIMNRLVRAAEGRIIT